MKEKIHGKEYIWLPSTQKSEKAVQTSFLMPDYDEYGMSYEDRTAMMSKTVDKPMLQYNRMLVIDGRVEGTWKREFIKREMIVETAPFAPLSMAEEKKVTQSIARFRQFATQ